MVQEAANIQASLILSAYRNGNLCYFDHQGLKSLTTTNCPCGAKTGSAKFKTGVACVICGLF